MAAVNRLDGSPLSDHNSGLNLHNRSDRHTPSSSSDRGSDKSNEESPLNEGSLSPGEEKKVSARSHK